ncbi:MAG: phage terminase small subunit P27 family [Roseibacillus sp.]
MSDGGKGLRCPSYLDAEGKKAWGELRSLMAEAGTLDVADSKPLELFGMSFSRMRRAQKDIEKHGEVLRLKTDRGSETVRKNPSVDIENTAADRCVRLLSICGIDLRSRSALGLGMVEVELDPFEELYRQSRKRSHGPEI